MKNYKRVVNKDIIFCFTRTKVIIIIKYKNNNIKSVFKNLLYDDFFKSMKKNWLLVFEYYDKYIILINFKEISVENV